MNKELSAAIARKNDLFRKIPVGGTIICTAGIQAKPLEWMVRCFEAISKFTDFNADNDSHGEHDLVVVYIDGEKVFAKFDYYEDATMTYGAENGLDCYRVLTIMLANEY